MYSQNINLSEILCLQPFITHLRSTWYFSPDMSTIRKKQQLDGCVQFGDHTIPMDHTRGTVAETHHNKLAHTRKDSLPRLPKLRRKFGENACSLHQVPRSHLIRCLRRPTQTMHSIPGCLSSLNVSSRVMLVVLVPTAQQLYDRSTEKHATGENSNRPRFSYHIVELYNKSTRIIILATMTRACISEKFQERHTRKETGRELPSTELNCAISQRESF